MDKSQIKQTLDPQDMILVIVTIHGMIVHILVYKFQNNKKKYLNKNNILDGNKISTTIKRIQRHKQS